MYLFNYPSTYLSVCLSVYKNDVNVTCTQSGWLKHPVWSECMSAASFGTWQTASFSAPDDTGRWTLACAGTHTALALIFLLQVWNTRWPPSLYLTKTYFLAILLQSNLKCVCRKHVEEKDWPTPYSIPLGVETATLKQKLSSLVLSVGYTQGNKFSLVKLHCQLCFQ